MLWVQRSAVGALSRCVQLQVVSASSHLAREPIQRGQISGPPQPRLEAAHCPVRFAATPARRSDAASLPGIGGSDARGGTRARSSASRRQAASLGTITPPSASRCPPRQPCQMPHLVAKAERAEETEEEREEQEVNAGSAMDPPQKEVVLGTAHCVTSQPTTVGERGAAAVTHTLPEEETAVGAALDRLPLVRRQPWANVGRAANSSGEG